MDGTIFTRLVRRTHPMQGLRLRFDRQTGMIGLGRLKLLCESNAQIRIEDRDYVVVLAILASQDWGGDQNRTVGVHGLCAADQDYLYQIGRDVEHLELSGEHGAQGIMVKRQKTRDEAVEKIISGVLAADLVHEIEDWGLTIAGELVEYLNTPAIQFMICRTEGEMILRVTLDGWTGRYGIDGNVNNGPNELYIRPQQLQDFIRASLEKRLEVLTTDKAA
jgi:hypothetical protein